jgi:hypothetical protein
LWISSPRNFCGPSFRRSSTAKSLSARSSLPPPFFI